MMYGGEVELREENVKTILKFSVVYQIQEMYYLCQEWIRENLSKVNLFEFIQFGLLIHIIGQDNRDILDICMGYIRDNVKDELIQISKGLSFERNMPFVKFLAQEEILQVTLPLITAWVKSDENYSMILDEFDSKNITDSLFEYGEMAVDLLDKMGDVADDKEMFKLLKIQNTLARRVTDKCRCLKVPEHKDLKVLLSQDYRSFTVDKLLGIEAEYSLKHARFVDIALAWMNLNQPSQDAFDRIWGQVRPEDLAYQYLLQVRYGIHIQDSTSLLVPKINCNLKDICAFSVKKLTMISELNSVVVQMKQQCKTCSNQISFKVKFVDKTPCYEVLIDYGCVELELIYLIWPNESYRILSLLTNDYTSVREKIRQYIDTDVYIAFLYKCTNE